MISFILAVDKNWLLGNSESKNGLPWESEEDFKWFVKKTTGKKVAMGAKTFTAIGKALPNRENIIFSRSMKNDEVTVVSDLDLFCREHENTKEEIMVIGGKEVFLLATKYCQKIYLTIINEAYKGDIYYEEIQLVIKEQFKLEKQHIGEDEKLNFKTYQRNK